MHEGDELVEAPFKRLIEADQLDRPSVTKASGVQWITLKDKQVLEDLVDKGTMPWLLNPAVSADLVEAGRKTG